MGDEQQDYTSIPSPAPVPAGSGPAPRGTTRTVVAGAIGNVLEWYDFGLIGFFAPVISRLFFPVGNQWIALLETFGVFAVGFLMRPLGGVLLGSLGDRLGRKLALELSVVLMAIPTTLLGLLPTHAQIGFAAPLFLTLIRIVQGLSVGGEYVGSMSFLVEHAPAARRGYLGSWCSSGVAIGTLLGSGIAALLTGLLSEAQLSAWGWRLPFLGGAVLGVAGLWLRRSVEESPAFLHSRQTGGLAQHPVREVLRNDFGAILKALGLTTMISIGFYVPFVWLATWLARINQPPLREDQALTATTVGLLVMLGLIPLTGLASDHFGRKPVLLASALGWIVLSYPLFLLMAGGTFATALLALVGFAMCGSLYSGCMAATLVELFPTRTRYTGVAIGYNGAMAILGGTAPLVATGLIGVTGNVLAPAFYLMAAGVVAGVAILFIDERHGQPLP